MRNFALLVVALGLPSASVLARPTTPRPKTTCAPAGFDWLKGAGDYLQTNIGAGKRPAIYATVSLVSTEPASALAGKSPDRTGLWYAHGEVTRANFPVITTLSGKFPLWINNGTPNSPFNGNNTTLALSMSDSGSASLHFQVDGRNRMGRGPQSVPLSAVASGSDGTTQMFSAATNFFGPKLIVVALTKGEAVGVTPPPAPLKQPVGARYRVSTSFLVTNSSDGAGDNTVEVWGLISFVHNGQTLPQFDMKGDKRGKGGRINGPSFEVETTLAKTETLRLRFAGNAYDVQQH